MIPSIPTQLWRLSALVVAALVLVACRSGTEATAPVPANPWLDEIELDSPIVIANNRRLSDGQWNRLMSPARWPGLLDGAAQWRRYPSIGGILDQLQTAERWRAAGFDPNGFFAVHARPNQLIARLPLSDVEAFWRWWSQLQPDWPPATAGPDDGSTATRMTLPAGRWLSEQAAPSVVELVARADHLTVIWHLAGTNNQSGRRVPPAINPWTAKRWHRFNEDHRFDGHLSARINLDTALTQAGWVSAACRALWPPDALPVRSIRLGTHRLDDNQLHWRASIDTPLWRPDPTLDEPTGPAVDATAVRHAKIAGIGFAVNLSRIRERMLAWTDAADAGASACPHAEALSRQRRRVRSLANRPIPPLFSGVMGLTSRLEGWADTSTGPAPQYATELFLRDPQVVLGLAQLFSPDLARLDLRPNQTPVALPKKLTDMVAGVPVYLSTTPSSIRASATPDVPRQRSTRSQQRLLGDSASDDVVPWVMGVVQLDQLDVLRDSLSLWPAIAAQAEWLERVRSWGQITQTERIEFQLGVDRSSLEVDLSMAGGTSTPQ